jgi:hypothetical protein
VKCLYQIDKNNTLDYAFKKGSGIYARNLFDDVTRIYWRKLHVASLIKLRNYVAETYVFGEERNVYWAQFLSPIDDLMREEEKFQLEAFMQKRLKEKNLCQLIFILK